MPALQCLMEHWEGFSEMFIQYSGDHAVILSDVQGPVELSRSISRKGRPSVVPDGPDARPLFTIGVTRTLVVPSSSDV